MNLPLTNTCGTLMTPVFAFSTYRERTLACHESAGLKDNLTCCTGPLRGSPRWSSSITCMGMPAALSARWQPWACGQYLSGRNHAVQLWLSGEGEVGQFSPLREHDCDVLECKLFADKLRGNVCHF